MWYLITSFPFYSVVPLYWHESCSGALMSLFPSRSNKVFPRCWKGKAVFVMKGKMLYTMFIYAQIKDNDIEQSWIKNVAMFPYLYIIMFSNYKSSGVTVQYMNMYISISFVNGIVSQFMLNNIDLKQFLFSAFDQNSLLKPFWQVFVNK